MILRLLWLLVGPGPAPSEVVIATPRGETTVPVTMQRGSAAVAAPLLAQPLGSVVTHQGSRATVSLAGTVFLFQLGAPFVRVDGVVYGLVELPVAAAVAGVPPPTATAPTPASPASSPVRAGAAPNPLTGLRFHHTVVIDPGHGGADPGNPGRFFPAGLVEKDITLAIARLLKAELTRRDIGAALTRSSDTLIDLTDRGTLCRADCDLFVSIHVNAMPVGRRAERASGVETYYLSDAKNEDQQRVANMENDAIRFESAPARAAKGPIDFILKDLQLNEYLRESARLAELVQDSVAAVHPGGDHGVQQAAFMVLTTARRPAILVETGFATNRTDGAFLATAFGQHKIASAVAEGIAAYLQEFERKAPRDSP